MNAKISVRTGMEKKNFLIIVFLLKFTVLCNGLQYSREQRASQGIRRLMKKAERDIAKQIVEKLQGEGGEAYFVGGCVRDMLMGKEALDYDIATSVRPEDIAAIFSRVVPVGKQFGVMIVLEGGHSFQVATFRSDLEYRDGRKPSGIVFSSAREDVMRRDFTINGLLYDPVDERLHDYVGGAEDIKKRIIRTIGNPGDRFEEDKLRLLRAVRFSSTLNFEIEKETFAAIRRLAGEIRVVSNERIGEELVKMMIGPNAGRGLELLDRTGLLEVVLPEVAAMKDVQQPRRFHPEGDVFRHTMKMLDMLEQPSVVVAFSVLLHDVGKPPTYEVRERIRFPKHQNVGAEMANRICRRLRFPGHIRDRIAACVENHMVFLEAKNMRASTIKRLINRPTFYDELELHRLDCLASDGDLSAYEFVQAKAEEFSREEIQPEPLVTGRDFLKLGYPEGPVIGKMLAEIEELQLEGKLATREQALEWIDKRWGKREGSE
jgi:poly(A) polymerase